MVYAAAFCFAATLLLAAWLRRERYCTEAGSAWISQAVQQAGGGVWLWDVTRDQIRITAPVSMLSYRAWLMSLHADDRESVHQAIQCALDEKKSYRAEYRILHQDGSERWVSMQGGGCVDGTGRFSRMIGILSDITVYKQAEQALKVQSQALLHMARVATLGELSAALAHELSQPLSAILCNAQAGQRFLAHTPHDPNELRAILADIVADDQRAGAVVARLRGLFRKEDAVRQVLDINTLVEEAAQLLRSELITRQTSLFLHLGAGLPKTMGDPVQLRQVLLNLIINGAEAMAASMSCSRQLKVCTSMHDTDGLEVVVRDTGPGIAPHMLERIFEPFITGKPHGLGMGLAISRTIIAAHGGRLWADNLPEGGAAMRFTLPIFRGLNS